MWVGVRILHIHSFFENAFILVIIRGLAFSSSLLPLTNKHWFTAVISVTESTQDIIRK